MGYVLYVAVILGGMVVIISNNNIFFKKAKVTFFFGVCLIELETFFLFRMWGRKMACVLPHSPNPIRLPALPVF